jgi:hypothetical protein
VPAEWQCQAVAPSAVPSAGRGSSHGPSLACPPECCEAAAVSALLVHAEWQCQTETVAPSAVPSAGRGSSHGPSLACPPECCEAAAVSALLLQALLAFWDRSAFYHTQRHHYLRRAKNMMGNILNI